MIFQTSMIMFHVNLPGCSSPSRFPMGGPSSPFSTPLSFPYRAARTVRNGPRAPPRAWTAGGCHGHNIPMTQLNIFLMDPQKTGLNHQNPQQKPKTFPWIFLYSTFIDFLKRTICGKNKQLKVSNCSFKLMTNSMGNTLIHEKTFQKTLRFGYQMSSGCEIAEKKDAGTHVAGNYHINKKSKQFM